MTSEKSFIQPQVIHLPSQPRVSETIGEILPDSYEATIWNCKGCGELLIAEYIDLALDNSRDRDSAKCPCCGDASQSIHSASWPSVTRVSDRFLELLKENYKMQAELANEQLKRTQPNLWKRYEIDHVLPD